MPKETPPRKPHRITLYIDRHGEFQWRRQAGNAQIVSASTEGYKTKADMLTNMITANADHLACPISDKTDSGAFLGRGALQ
ncbi:hypothetical protein BJF84_21390 [Rhodococcus sp. CUA-806]|nr:hypothetical protein BJF84_21390 [Rhodococcus sp. CUA-806]